jgi:hypothetical protein
MATEDSEPPPSRRGRHTSLGDIYSKVEALSDDIHGIKRDLERVYVRKEEFTPVKTITYGFVALILTAVVAALIGSVVYKQGGPSTPPTIIYQVPPEYTSPSPVPAAPRPSI